MSYDRLNVAIEARRAFFGCHERLVHSVFGLTFTVNHALGRETPEWMRSCHRLSDAPRYDRRCTGHEFPGLAMGMMWGMSRVKWIVENLRGPWKVMVNGDSEPPRIFGHPVVVLADHRDAVHYRLMFDPPPRNVRIVG